MPSLPSPHIKHVTYKKYAGAVVRGNKRWKTPGDIFHITRAFWLSGQLEGGGTFGTVQCYDGAGMSAGLEHKIALFPRTMTQGPLFVVLDRMRDDPQIAGAPTMKNLLREFETVGWILDPNGTLRHHSTGTAITGQELRTQFTPPNGTVPGVGPQWEQCKKWTLLFHELFADPSTFASQIKLGKASLSNLDPTEASAYKKIVGVDNPSVLQAGVNIREDQDLALCVYHSHAVNAPSVARKVLANSSPDATSAWPIRFLRALHAAQYGNWDIRWTRTRSVALHSGLWSAGLFAGPHAIMPENP